MKIWKSHAVLKAALGAASIAGVIMLTGCAGSLNSDRIGNHGEKRDFPDVSDSWYDDGRFVDPDSIQRIRKGQTKEQVRQLIGNPHFSEGLFGVREWNYVFNLYTGESGGDYITCQYQVEFDDDMALENTRWRDAQCPALLMPTEMPEDETLVLSGDVLFDFDSDQLTLDGRRALSNVAQSVRDEFKIPGIRIVGYTDRFGSEAYNQELSRLRATTVADYFSTQGINRRNIQALGRGEANPVVECPGARATPSVTECLRPNRRVEITISELAEG